MSTVNEVGIPPIQAEAVTPVSAPGKAAPAQSPANDHFSAAGMAFRHQAAGTERRGPSVPPFHDRNRHQRPEAELSR